MSYFKIKENFIQNNDPYAWEAKHKSSAFISGVWKFDREGSSEGKMNIRTKDQI